MEAILKLKKKTQFEKNSCRIKFYCYKELFDKFVSETFNKTKKLNTLEKTSFAPKDKMPQPVFRLLEIRHLYWRNFSAFA